MANLLFTSKQERLDSEFAELNARNTPASRQALRDSIAADVEAFLANGNNITEVGIAATGITEKTRKELADNTYQSAQERREKSALILG